MRPYGVKVIRHPDVGDLQAMGAKSSAGHVRGPGGDFRDYRKSRNIKARMRRYWKRQARKEGKNLCKDTE